MALTVEAAEPTTLIAAQGGDEQAFEALTRPFLRELHVHCYRMLGTMEDADDALQDTLLRAWRQIARFEPRAPLRAWLYRIATNVCLTALARRGKAAALSIDALANGSSAEGEPVYLDPYPDRLLDELPPSIPGPEASIVERESVELAFVAAVQLLPPRQRATLLLRDVIGYPAAEVASMLETNVAAVNSALQRARATLAQAQTSSRVTRPHTPPSSETERALVRRLVAAWQAVDVPGIVAILTEDALFSMPPLPQHYVGREAIAAFLNTGPAGWRLDRFQFIPTRANRQPALAAYWRDGDAGPFHAHGLILVAIEGEAIASLTRFGDAALFTRFDLPMMIEG
ncbi:MAG: RNA polymerase subunit sigma-70 [Thermomicrobiales bacterium]